MRLDELAEGERFFFFAAPRFSGRIRLLFYFIFSFFLCSSCIGEDGEDGDDGDADSDSGASRISWGGSVVG